MRKVAVFLTVLGLAVLPACSGQVAEDFEQVSSTERIVMKFSHVVAENTPKGIAARRFASQVKERTNGLVEVQVFPNSQLYKDGEELDALRRNEVQFIAPSLSKLGEVDPLWQVFDLPYLLTDRASIERLMAGQTGRRLHESLTRQGLEALTFWDNGFKVVTNGRGPVRLPAEARGLRFRIQPSHVTSDAFVALGAEASVQTFDSLYGVLADKVLDAQENVPSNIYSKRVYEVQPYMTITNHSYLGYVVITNQKFWSSLDPQLRRIVQDALEDTSAWVWENASRLNDQALDRIRATGKVRIDLLTPEERELWRLAMSPAYRKAEDRLGAEVIREAIREAGAH